MILNPNLLSCLTVWQWKITHKGLMKRNLFDLDPISWNKQRTRDDIRRLFTKNAIYIKFSYENSFICFCELLDRN